MIMTDLGCTILIPELFDSPSRGKEFLELFVRILPNHVPQRCGSNEPLRKRFVVDDIDAALKQWGPGDFIAQRQNPRLYLHVYFSQPSLAQPRHTVISIYDIEAPTWESVLAFKTFLKEAAACFDADLAVAHIFTRQEFSERVDHLRTLPGANPEYMMRKAEQQGVAVTLGGMTLMQYSMHKQLKHYLPDLPWLTIFGRPYVELFGRERIESTPANEVSWLPNGSCLMNVIDDIPDTSEGWAHFKMSRDRCKRHLDSNAFYDPALPRGHIYRVPEFQFPMEMYKPTILP